MSTTPKSSRKQKQRTTTPKSSSPFYSTKLEDKFSSLSVSEYVCPESFVVHNAQTSPFTTHMKAIRCWMFVDDMNHLEIESGQRIVVQYGARHVICISWPSDMVESANVHLSGIQRFNLTLEISDSVKIRKLDEFKITIADMISINIVSDTDGKLFQDKEFKHFCTDALFELQYLTQNFDFELIYRGAKRLLRVHHNSESSIARLDPHTKFNYIVPDCQRKPKGIDKSLSYDSIGGLDTQIKSIREFIEIPLFYSERFTQYGLKPPRGVLLYGPSGTGKTFIAKVVAAQTDVNFVTINTFDIISGLYGESEAKLRSIFLNAIENAPSIIFIDEIDSLCPKREKGSGMDRRIMTTLLTLMDGFSDASTDQCIVLATTNKPDSLDEALRRPGRFDHEIEIPIPDSHARFEILKALLKDVPNDVSAEQLMKVSGKAHGYVGADLSNIVKESGVSMLREFYDLKSDPNLDCDDVKLSYRHLMDGMSRVRPSGMREIVLEVPSVRWTDIGGQEETKRRLREAVEWPIKNPEVFSKFGIKPPKGLLLYGPPGCSKTLMAKALATESGLNFFAVKGPELFNKYVGESEKALRELFRKARAASPSIIFFDEIDSIASKRGSNGEGVSVGDRVISQLLTELDGINSLCNVTIVAATNRPDVMDSALMRPGRLDRILYVGPPDLESRIHILRIRFSKMSISDDVKIELLANETEGFSGAEMVALCQEAGFSAMEEDVSIKAISMRHFLYALQRITPRITTEMLQFYADFQRRSGLSAL